MKTCIVKRKCPACGHYSGWYPAYGRDREYFDKQPYHIIYTAEIKKPRNPDYHALVFAMVRCLKANLPEKYERLKYFTEYDLLKAIMMDIGQTEKRQKLNGEIYEVPKSVSFEKMDSDEFQEVGDKIAKLCAKVLEIDEVEFRTNYQNYL